MQAKFSNRFHVWVNPATTRIVFGDAVVGTDADYHTAIVLPTHDAEELASLIARIVSEVRASQQRTGEKDE